MDNTLSFNLMLGDDFTIVLFLPCRERQARKDIQAMAVSQALMESREREDFQASLVFQVAQGFQGIKVRSLMNFQYASLEGYEHLRCKCYLFISYFSLFPR